MYVDELPDGTVLVSNFLTAQLYRIDPHGISAELLVDGKTLGEGELIAIDGSAGVVIAYAPRSRGLQAGQEWRFPPLVCQWLLLR